MGYSQAEVARRFAEGETTGKASNVEIQEHGKAGTILVGYGHAVYAYRAPNGNITVYGGWANSENTRRWAGTVSTKTQFSKMRLKSRADNLVEGVDMHAAPKVASFKPPIFV